MLRVTYIPAGCRLNDLISKVYSLGRKIDAVTLAEMLLPIEVSVTEMATEFKDVLEMSEWVNKLHKSILLRRCELLTRETAQL